MKAVAFCIVGGVAVADKSLRKTLLSCFALTSVCTSIHEPSAAASIHVVVYKFLQRQYLEPIRE